MSLAKRPKTLLLITFVPSLVLMLLTYAGEEAFAQQPNDQSFIESAVSNANSFWANEFQKLGVPYTPAKLRFVYNKPVDGTCGSFSTDIGPAYCAADQTIYYPVDWLDNGQTLADYGTSAVEWGIGHEVGHNVQWQMYDAGIQSLIPYPETTLVEMQADCFAGMYAKQALTSPAGIEGALQAMQLVSQRRIAAFELGYNTGDLSQCLALANEGTTPNDSGTTTDGGTTTNTPAGGNTTNGETTSGNGTVGG